MGAREAAPEYPLPGLQHALSDVQVPHLASHLLSRMARMLPHRAANWISSGVRQLKAVVATYALLKTELQSKKTSIERLQPAMKTFGRHTARASLLRSNRYMLIRIR